MVARHRRPIGKGHRSGQARFHSTGAARTTCRPAQKYPEKVQQRENREPSSNNRCYKQQSERWEDGIIHFANKYATTLREVPADTFSFHQLTDNALANSKKSTSPALCTSKASNRRSSTSSAAAELGLGSLATDVPSRRVLASPRQSLSRTVSRSWRTHRCTAGLVSRPWPFRASFKTPNVCATEVLQSCVSRRARSKVSCRRINS